MSKKNIIIVAVIVTVLVFLGGLVFVINQIQKQNEAKEKREKELRENYKEFNEYASLFSDKRLEYTESVIENLYYESVKSDYDKWIDVLKSYNELVDNILKTAKPLEKLCVSQVYSDKELQNNCDAYIINYETVMNYFVKDVEEFNSFITDYNSENEDDQVDTYALDADKYNYLDVNDDGKFIGKD